MSVVKISKETFEAMGLRGGRGKPSKYEGVFQAIPAIGDCARVGMNGWGVKSLSSLYQGIHSAAKTRGIKIKTRLLKETNEIALQRVG